jgi:hypothetical protein
MDLPIIGRKYVDVTPDITLRNGATDTVTAVDIGLSRPGGDSSTIYAWLIAIPVNEGVATFSLVGVLAPNKTGINVLEVPRDSDLWARVNDNPESDAEMIDHIRLI